MKKVTIYRDDSTTQVVIENVKHYFWTANNTVLTLAVVSNAETGEHYYIDWPRERFCWFKVQPAAAMNANVIVYNLADNIDTPSPIWNEFERIYMELMTTMMIPESLLTSTGYGTPPSFLQQAMGRGYRTPTTAQVDLFSTWK